MTVAMYARRKQWPLASVTVRLSYSRIHAGDCAEAETQVGFLDHIHRDVEFSGPLSDQQRARLLDIASKCPVHCTLDSDTVIETHLTEPGAPGVPVL
jgi:putative redox protein